MHVAVRRPHALHSSTPRFIAREAAHEAPSGRSYCPFRTIFYCERPQFASCCTSILLTVFQKDCEERGQLFGFSLENLVLRRIDVVSRSAIRPVLDFVVPTD